MANANIALITITNTFDEWRIATNAVANDRNQLRNSYYVKDEGDLRVANGVLYLGPIDGGTAMVVEGNSNISIGNMTTTSNLTVLANASVGNLVINGNQTIVGDTLLDTNLLLLRANASADGNATIRSRRTGTGNAELFFNNTSQVWQASANAAVGRSTIITMANVENSTFSTSLSNVATAAAVGTAYSLALSGFVESQASANTVRVSQNGGSTISKAGLNFVNTTNVIIAVTSGIAGNANIAFDVVGGAGTQGPQGASGLSVQGAQGTAGTTQGAQGVQGSQGTSVQGAQGTSVQGAQGIQGISVQGAQGTSGTAGSITDDTSSSSTHYPLLTTSTSGTLSGVTVSSTKLSFVPNSGIVTATDFSATSDERLKDVVQEVENAVKLVESLRGVEYKWNDTAKNIGVSDDERVQVGLIAQDAEKLYESLVVKGEDGYLRLSYDRLVPILVEAIKELSERVKRLEG
jgi:hypothetical protein